MKLGLGREELQRAGRNKAHMYGRAAPCARRFLPADMARRRALISANQAPADPYKERMMTEVRRPSKWSHHMKSGTLSCAADDKLRTERRSATGEKRYSRRAEGEPGPPPTRRREEDSHHHSKIRRRAHAGQRRDRALTRARRADNAVRRYGCANECVDEVKYRVCSKMHMYNGGAVSLPHVSQFEITIS